MYADLSVSLCFSLFLGPLPLRVSGMVAPVLAEVLYDKGPVWPLAVFCPTMLLVAIFAGGFFVGRTAALVVALHGATTAVLAVFNVVASTHRHKNRVCSGIPRLFSGFALFSFLVNLFLLVPSPISRFVGLFWVTRARAHLEGILAVFLAKKTHAMHQSNVLTVVWSRLNLNDGVLSFRASFCARSTATCRISARERASQLFLLDRSDSRGDRWP